MQESDKKSCAKSKHIYLTDAHETKTIQNLNICSLPCSY